MSWKKHTEMKQKCITFQKIINFCWLFVGRPSHFCSHGTARSHGLFLSWHGTARGHNPRLYDSTARHGELLLHFTGLHGRKPCGKRQHPSVLWPVKPSECMARHGRDNYSHCTAFHGTGCLHYKTSRHGTALHGRFLEQGISLGTDSLTPANSLVFHHCTPCTGAGRDVGGATDLIRLDFGFGIHF